MEKSIQFYRQQLMKEMEEAAMCNECGGLMERGMCTECGWMEEALVGGQKKLDVAEPKGELTAADFDKLRSMKKEDEGQDHEVSMAKNSLDAIIKSAQELLMKMGSEEKDIPAWIQDHITNAENYIEQASQNYHEYEADHDQSSDELDQLAEKKDFNFQVIRALIEEAKKKKPSAGLTKKQKSAVAKKARAGKDVGKKGKGFAAVEKKAKAAGAKNPKAVAAAAMWKGVKARSHKK